MSKIIKLLAVNTGYEGLQVQTHEIPSEPRDKLQSKILELLNVMGKRSHVLIKWDNKLYTIHHTAQRGPSSHYLRAEVTYHPYANQLT